MEGIPDHRDLLLHRDKNRTGTFMNIKLLKDTVNFPTVESIKVFSKVYDREPKDSTFVQRVKSRRCRRHHRSPTGRHLVHVTTGGIDKDGEKLSSGAKFQAHKRLAG